MELDNYNLFIAPSPPIRATNMLKKHVGFFNDFHRYKEHPIMEISFYRRWFSAVKFYFEIISKPGEEALVILCNIRQCLMTFLSKYENLDKEEALMKIIFLSVESKLESTTFLSYFIKKLPTSLRPSYEEDIEYIANCIPWDLVNPNQNVTEQFKIESQVPTINSIFSHSVNLKLNENQVKTRDLDNLFQYVKNPLQGDKRQTNKNAKDRYPLFNIFQIYRSKMPAFSNYEEFANHVRQELSCNKRKDQLVNDFLDAFGCEVFDLIMELVEYELEDVDFTCPYDDETVKKFVSKKKQVRNTPAMASQIIVQSEEEKLLSKKIRKLEKKDRNKFVENVDSLTEDLTNEQMRPLLTKIPEHVETYPHVYDIKLTKAATIHSGSSIKLPETAVQKKTNLYTEITIPAQATERLKDDFKLIEVKDLDVTGQLVFKDIKKFNRIQSEVFPVAYNTNENLLICAPTGAGKTNIALLAMVHKIKSFMTENTVQHSNFKIIYVSPMKALATEMAANFSKKLGPIGITVKELTGEMQLTKKQIAETHVIVITPEKLDIITRKGAVDTEIASQMKLLIIDEVHLLNGTRGPVIESIVTRVLRQVISTQSMIRIVALSATLPGYLDVAAFLRVNPYSGLFFFDNRFRSVPLSYTYLGVLASHDNMDTMNKICYQQMKPFIKSGHQVMVFVTARNQTASAAKSFISQARELNELDMYLPPKSFRNLNYTFKNSFVQELVHQGFGTHHAGICRGDRLEIESLFRNGHLKVIVCTATLAWGVNLPAHAVIIRGTSMYDPQQSKFVDIDVLDVLQIFGRAGRPQYDTSGHATIITSQSKMPFYMNMLMSQSPIESRFLDKLPDNLNGEIVLGTISNLKEALEWIKSTYLFYRLRKNPLNYGLSHADLADGLEYDFLQRQIYKAIEILENAQMIRYHNATGEMRTTSYGRIASFLYITHETITLFQTNMRRYMTEDEILILISSAVEFQQIQVRNDELEELDRLRKEYGRLEIDLDITVVEMKVAVLIQTCISRGYIKVSSLASDSEYIMQNVVRLALTLHQLAIEKNYARLVDTTLVIAQMLEQRTWNDDHPLTQFKELTPRGTNLLASINVDVDELRCLKDAEIIQLMGNRSVGYRVAHFAKAFPKVSFDIVVKPITENVVRIKLLIVPDFKWDHSIHGSIQQFCIVVEDSMNDSVPHYEKFNITERMTTSSGHPIELTFTVPLEKGGTPELYVRVMNLHYLHTTVEKEIDFTKIALIPSYGIETKFLNVRPLPITALRNEAFQSIYPFEYFNAVQSQVFFCCYNTDQNILLGAPTGSGKTIVSELCILRLFNCDSAKKVIYIAPMKALVRERVKDWVQKFKKIDKRVVEVTGDVTPHSDLIASARIIITTPEKWDGMSRNWHQKDYVKNVGLMIIDEIHLLAEERGPVLEVIVSRMNHINTFGKDSVRIVGLSTAMANAGDLANWLGVKEGLFNFSSAVRPVPLEIHVTGFAGKHYCPRMATMNRPAYQAICQYAPDSPTLIFVSSRKQTRITAHELIKLLMVDVNQKQWRKCSETDIDMYRSKIHDSDLAYMLQFGIAIHHAGLQERDRDIVEELFVSQKIQILIATATLAWGVNFPAHLVIIKGTEYFDGATKRYVDMPVTDVLQMMGRAGRPQFDNSGVACVFVEESKKNFYRKFLFEPFPVESSLLKVLPDHVNAEISNGTINGKEELIDFICSTFFFRRLVINPSYYGQNTTEVKSFLDELASSVAMTLDEAGCIQVTENSPKEVIYESTFLGRLAAKYYLTYKTVVFFDAQLQENMSIVDLLLIICHAQEYALFPVRHNEDKINGQLLRDLDLKLDLSPDSPHLKVYLLIYCYINGVNLPNQEYVIDLKTVFDQVIRITQALLCLSAHKGWLDSSHKLAFISQMIIQGQLVTSSSMRMLPNLDDTSISRLAGELETQIGWCKENELSVPFLQNILWQSKQNFTKVLNKLFENKAKSILDVLRSIPYINIKVIMTKIEDNSNMNYKVNQDLLTIEVDADRNSTFFLTLNMERNGGNLNVFSQNFVKQKDESWLCFISMNNHLKFFQQLTFKSSKVLQTQLNTPSERGQYSIIIDFLSDSYIGIDQKIVINMNVK